MDKYVAEFPTDYTDTIHNNSLLLLNEKYSVSGRLAGKPYCIHSNALQIKSFQ